MSVPQHQQASGSWLRNHLLSSFRKENFKDLRYICRYCDAEVSRTMFATHLYKNHPEQLSDEEKQKVEIALRNKPIRRSRKSEKEETEEPLAKRGKLFSALPMSAESWISIQDGSSAPAESISNLTFVVMELSQRVETLEREVSELKLKQSSLEQN